MGLTKYGLGCLDDLKTYRPDAFYGKGIGIADQSNYDLLKFGRFDLHQKTSQSCVLYSAAQRLWIDMQVHGGRSPILASPMAWYWSTRRKTSGGGPVMDLGCRPGDFMDVLKEVGWAPWKAWEGVDAQGRENVETWSLALVNKQPDLDIFQKMADRKWVRDIRIGSEGNARVLDMQVLIAREKKAIGAGLVIDETYETWKASDGPWRRTRPAVGRHMVTPVAFEAGLFYCIGSYGAGNAEGNVVQVAADVFALHETEPLCYLDIDWSKVPT